MRRLVLVVIGVAVAAIVGWGLLVSIRPGVPVETDTTTGAKTMDFAGQGLTAFPTEALKHPELQELDISRNAIGAIPAEIGHLSELTVLRASHDGLTGIPAEIGHLPKLRYLDLSDNSLTGLPHELADLKSLQTLVLTGNADLSQADLDYITSRSPGLEIIH